MESAVEVDAIHSPRGKVKTTNWEAGVPFLRRSLALPQASLTRYYRRSAATLTDRSAGAQPVRRLVADQSHRVLWASVHVPRRSAPFQFYSGRSPVGPPSPYSRPTVRPSVGVLITPISSTGRIDRRRDSHHSPSPQQDLRKGWSLGSG